MKDSPYPSSRCRRCKKPILCIPAGDGLWVHETADNEWGYDSAMCDIGPIKGVLAVAKPRKRDRDAGWWGKP